MILGQLRIRARQTKNAPLVIYNKYQSYKYELGTDQEDFLVSLCPAWFHKMHYSVLAACLLSRCHDLGEKVSNDTVQKMFMYKRPVYLEWAHFK